MDLFCFSADLKSTRHTVCLCMSFAAAARFWNTPPPGSAPMSARAWKRQRTGRSREAVAPGGFARSMAFGQPSFRRVSRFRGAMSGRYARRFSSRGSAFKGRETGFVDLSAATYALNTTGSVTLLATIPQGTSVNTRVGKKVVLKSIQGRGFIGTDTATTIVSTSFALIYDKRPQNALPAITDIFTSASSLTFNNDANSGRFRILKRVDAVLCGSSTAPSTGLEILPADFFLDLKGLKCEFGAGGTGAIGDIATGALYLVSMGSTAAGTADANLIMGFRTRFVDV